MVRTSHGFAHSSASVQHAWNAFANAGQTTVNVVVWKRYTVLDQLILTVVHSCVLLSKLCSDTCCLPHASRRAAPELATLMSMRCCCSCEGPSTQTAASYAALPSPWMALWTMSWRTGRSGPWNSACGPRPSATCCAASTAWSSTQPFLPSGESFRTWTMPRSVLMHAQLVPCFLLVSLLPTEVSSIVAVRSSRCRHPPPKGESPCVTIDFVHHVHGPSKVLMADAKASGQGSHLQRSRPGLGAPCHSNLRPSQHAGRGLSGSIIMMMMQGGGTEEAGRKKAQAGCRGSQAGG